MAETRDPSQHKVLTPPINTSGVFTLYLPFTLPAGVVYRCSAIRTFSELEKHGISVYEKYYKPMSISEDTYKVDLGLKASIVTLVSGAGEEVFVPNTYIESYPGDSGVRYSRNVIVIDVGLIPETTDISYIKDLAVDLVKHNLGVTSSVEIVTAPYTGSVSHDQHVTWETARRAAVQGYVPLVEQIVTANAKVSLLQEQNNELLAIISQHPELFQSK